MTNLGKHRHYSAVIDRAGRHMQKKAVSLGRNHQMLDKFREHGYAVQELNQVAQLPLIVREQVASQIRVRWRRWIGVEVLIGAVSGPLAVPVAIAVLNGVLTAWSVELAVVYGIDATTPQNLQLVRAVIGDTLQECLMGSKGPNRTGRGRSWRVIASWALVGWGQEFLWADLVMARVRQMWREQSRTSALTG